VYGGGKGNVQMNHKTCGVCGAPLDHLVAEFNNLPAVAQNLPTKETLKADTGVDLCIYACPYCGCVQLDSEPVPYYREVIRASAVSPELREYKLEQFREFSDKYDLRDKKIIEIGCGGGEFLTILREYCPAVYGTEYSPTLARQCRNVNLNVYQTFVDRADAVIAEFKFDAFVMLNFLEHLPRPTEVLRGIWNNLNDGAVGMIEAPNLDMILKKQMYSEFMRDHLYYYTSRSLTNLVNICGFDVVEHNSLWHDYVLNITVKKRRKSNFQGIADYRRNVGAAFRQVVGKHRSVAVWGASHQAFFLLSCMDDASSIEFIIDSAPMKQGKFSPLSHRPIVAPPDSVDVDAVIVLAGSFSGEVTRILRDKYNFKGKIYLFEGSGLIETGKE
jgi:SAM-dependent methyltransferase